MSIRRLAADVSGSVLVIVGVGMFPILAMLAFAIDVPHWFDYSRSLQNRADAAALAGGVQYGGICFSPNPGDTTNGAQSEIGKWAQYYSGAFKGEPGGNLPYADNQVLNVNGRGANYINPTNLQAGTAANYFVRLNANDYADKGGTNFAMGDFCNANPANDATDHDPGTAGPMVDVKVTQASVPNFIKIFNIQPTLHAHARVELRNIQSSGDTRPIAVPDPAQVPCVVARVYDEDTNAILTTATLTKVANSNPPTWQGSTAAPVTVPLTGGEPDQISVAAFLPDDCTKPNGTGLEYDDQNHGGGLDFVNTYKAIPNPVTQPSIGSTFLTPSGCTNAAEGAAQDAYFYNFTASSHCTVTLNTTVAFPAGQGAGGVVASMDGATGIQMNQQGATNNYTLNFDIPPQSGKHTFKISWFQSASTFNNNCKTVANAKNNTACRFNSNAPLQATYSAYQDDSDPPDDSGPFIYATVGNTVGGIVQNTAGVDSLQQGTATTLFITYKMQGLQNSAPTDPPIILRTSVQASKRTGLLDCGQGNGASADSDAITNGCPHDLGIYNGTSCVVDPSANPWTCVDAIPGNRRNKIIQGFTDRIGNSCDNWQAYKASGTPIPEGDKRVFILVVTSPNDLSGGANGTPVKIYGAAAFYVTGWDGDNWSTGGTIPGCAAPTNKDEPYPGNGSSNFQIWGHYIKYVDLNATPNQQNCVANQLGVCVAALTR